MKSKYLFLIILGVILLGGVIFFFMSQSANKPDINPINTTDQNTSGSPQTTTVQKQVYVSPTTIPTFPPLEESIVRIDATNIIVKGVRGEMTIPKNDSLVKVFINQNGKLTEASFEDVKVGMKAILKIIVPGKQAELILEQ